MHIRAKIDDHFLKLYIPLEKQRPSSSGKTLIVASSYGVQRTQIRHEGKEIYVVANAFVYPAREKAEPEPKSKKSANPKSIRTRRSKN